MSPQADNVEAASVRQSNKRKRVKRRRATGKERKVFAARAVRIKKWERNIMKVQRTSLDEALHIGDYLNKTKDDFTRIDLGIGLEKWIVEECEMTYSRANKYMRLAKAAIERPEIRKMGLTEAMVSLGLITRKDFPKAGSSTGENGESATGESEGVSGDASDPIIRQIASYSAVQERDFFVLELDGEKWQDDLAAVVADEKNLGALLHEAGLLIRLKPEDEIVDDVEVEVLEDDESTDNEEVEVTA